MAIVYVNEESRAAIDRLAERSGRSKADIVEEVLRFFLTNGPDAKNLRPPPLAERVEATNRDPFSANGAPRTGE